MTASRLPELVDIGPGAVGRLAAFCSARKAGRAPGKGRLRLVADRNTWKALGEEAERELRASGLETRATVFDEPYLAADSRSILRLLLDDDPEEDTYVAIGSGTITDIVRFACHRTGRDFISLATAPSVDAYASIVAPLVVDGMKLTLPASAPIAVFADPEVLAMAPRPMIAAGFGDILCKYSAVADWRLGALLWGERFDEAIAARSLAAASACAAAARAIGDAEPRGVATLMEAMVESGLCMAQSGHSRSASGAEHHYSHYWELRLLKGGRPPILHGLKVAIGTLETARLWDRVRETPRARAAELLARSRPRSRPEEERLIADAFGDEAAGIAAGQERFLAMGETEFEDLKGRILSRWDEIRAIADSVPSRLETERLLSLAGCPLDPRDLGLEDGEIALGLSSAHYLRDRFTVKKLTRMLYD
jgi:glycerol-1-phosphate dehydrogenase [NAD(P)+]